MKHDRKLPYDIAVVGLGIVGSHQITREAEETIRRSNETFVIDSAVGVLDYLRTLCPKVTDLKTVYEFGIHRRLIYRQMASVVTAAAMERPPVCFAAYGHPKLYCYPTTLLQRAARVLNLKIEVLPGVSSLDTLMIDVNLDPGFDGLQVYDATDLLVHKRRVKIGVTCFIMQAAIVLATYNRPIAPKTENFQRLENYLLEFYPADHKDIVVISRTHPLLEAGRLTVPIGKLAAALRDS